MHTDTPLHASKPVIVVLLNQFLVPRRTCECACVLLQAFKEDLVAKRRIKKLLAGDVLSNSIPIQVPGDGNCLIHSVFLLIFGHVPSTEEVCQVRVAMAAHLRLIMDSHPASVPRLLLEESISNHTFLDMRHVQVLADIFAVNISIICPGEGENLLITKASDIANCDGHSVHRHEAGQPVGDPDHRMYTDV